MSNTPTNKNDANKTDADKPGPASTSGKEAELEAQVAKLREDMSGLAESLKALANDRADNAKRQAFALRDDVRETGERYFRQAQETAGELEEQVSERVRSEPIKSVLIAAAIGYFYARIFKN